MRELARELAPGSKIYFLNQLPLLCDIATGGGEAGGSFSEVMEKCGFAPAPLAASGRWLADDSGSVTLIHRCGDACSHNDLKVAVE